MSENGVTTNSGPVRIDLNAVLLERLGAKRMRWIPRALIRTLERMIRQDELNRLLRVAYPLRGSDFCSEILRQLDVSYDITHSDRLPQPGSDSRVIFVSNHPLGGLDGLIITELVAKATATNDIHFVVNDLLAAVEPLSDLFLPVNKHGRQSRQAIVRLEEAFAGPSPMMMFPAGLVSRLGAEGAIADLSWQKMFVNQAMKHHRDIIPLHFIGENSRFFYKFAALRKKLGMTFNIEQVRLPAELVGARGSHFTIVVGERIPWQTLQGGNKAIETAGKIRSIVYALKPQSNE